MTQTLQSHVLTGSTTLCRAWKVSRRDGIVLGFTDHDLDLSFDGTVFSARTGLSARALQQTAGLSVDNTEALGALSDAAVREEDIAAGRYDGAEVTAYLVNWQDSEQRQVLFRGSFGEIIRANGAFTVELRGLAEALNVPMGRGYHAGCSARLGDARCGVDLEAAGFTATATVETCQEGRSFVLGPAPGQAEDWFRAGQLVVQTGRAKGLAREIWEDRTGSGGRRIGLVSAILSAPEPGDVVLLVAGCDRRTPTCRTKFNNIVNYRGFPHVPGEDWLRRPPEQDPKVRNPFVDGAPAGPFAGFDLFGGGA